MFPYNSGERDLENKFIFGNQSILIFHFEGNRNLYKCHQILLLRIRKTKKKTVSTNAKKGVR